MVKNAKIEHSPRVLQVVTPPPGAGSNTSPTRDEVLFYTGQFAQVDNDLKAVQRRRKQLRQQAKLAGINLDALDRAIRERDKKDDTTLRNLRDFQLYCNFFDIPIGSQIQLFADPQNPKNYSEEARMKRAYQDGYDDGVAGTTADTQAYPEMTPEGQEYARGWSDGQKVNFDLFTKSSERMKAEEEQKAAARAAKKKASEDKDEDEGADGDVDAGGEGETQQAEAAE